MNRETESGMPRKHDGMDHQPSPRELERDLARTRSDLNDTLSEIEHRLSPDELRDKALDYLRGGPREFALNLSEQARDNPIPVALTAIGIGWLMYATRRGAHEREYTSEGIPESSPRRFGRIYGQAAEESRETYGSAVEKGKEAYGSAKEKGKEMYESAAESMQQMGETVGEKTKELRENMGERMAHAREGMERATKTLRRRARAMASGMRRGSEETASGIRQTGEKARSSFFYLLREQPLVLGALGLALGASMGAGLPTTRRERETFGPTRDELVNRARNVGREQVEKTREDLRQAASPSSSPVHSGTPS